MEVLSGCGADVVGWMRLAVEDSRMSTECVCHGKLGSGLASCRRKCHGKVWVRALRVFRDGNFVLLHTPTSPTLLLTTTMAPPEVVSFSPACSQSSNSGNDDIKYQQGTSQDDHPRPGVEDEVSYERDETRCLWGDEMSCASLKLSLGDILT